MNQPQKKKYIKLLLAVAAIIFAVGCTFQFAANSSKQNESATAITASSKATAASSQASKSKTYIVKAGDTLSSIAEANGISLDDLMAINNLTESALLSVGDELIIVLPDDYSAERQSTTDKKNIATETEIISEDLPSEYRENPELAANEEITIQTGIPREIEVVYEVTTVNGIEQSRSEINRSVISEGQPTIIERGIDPLAAAGPASPDMPGPAAEVASATLTSVMDDPAQGLAVGYTKLGVTISSLGINNPTPISQLAQLSGAEKYAGALTSANKNYMYGATHYYPLPLAPETIAAFNNGGLADFNLINQYFLELLNAERARLGVNPVQISGMTIEGTNQRSYEMAEYGDLRYTDPVTGAETAHLRPDGSSYISAFSYLPAGISVGENILQDAYNGNPYTLVSEQYIAERIFELFRSSPSHYSNFIMPDYTHNYLSIRLAENNQDNPNYITLIATQILSIEE